MSSLFIILFFGGWDSCFYSGKFLPELIFALKITLLVFLFIFIRANLPRYRFDQLMILGWKIFLPISLSFIFFCSGLLISLNALKIKQIHCLSDLYITI